MRIVLQRVRWARVTVGGEVVGSVGRGFLALVGIGRGDTEQIVAALAKKVAELRVFPDDADKMNRSVLDVQGACLVVSQFTLYADTSRGRRPFFGGAEAPERANELCQRFAAALRVLGVAVETGRFAANMQVELCNDGPVTITLEQEA